MQVIGYIRVSTEGQACEGVSLAAQQAKITAYATVKDWTLREVVCEAGVSDKSLKRPGLARPDGRTRGHTWRPGIAGRPGPHPRRLWPSGRTRP